MLSDEQMNLDTAEKTLLFQIREELRKHTEILQSLCPVRKDTGHKCKVCGVMYDNKGKMLACLRKHKKEG